MIRRDTHYSFDEWRMKSELLENKCLSRMRLDSKGTIVPANTDNRYHQLPFYCRLTLAVTR